jgi:hypothetical protein
VLHDDLAGLVNRLHRIAAAIDLGCDTPSVDGRPEVRAAMVDTCWESVRVAVALTHGVAEDDLWTGLPLLLDVWASVDARAGRVRLVDAGAVPAAASARSWADGLAELADAVAEVDAAQLAAVARPRDRAAATRAATAVAGLEGAADRLFVAALLDDVAGRVDASLAVLTAAAARAARERRTTARRG